MCFLFVDAWYIDVDLKSWQNDHDESIILTEFKIEHIVREQVLS